MREKQKFYDLDSKILFLGVPAIFFLFELGAVLLLIFVFKTNIILTPVFVFAIHFAVALLYKWSVNWMEELIMFLSLPVTKLYDENISYCPSDEELKKKI